ncbi:hypothetical protein HK102_011069, partial [Quaeritorhiza haematococci]
RGALITLWQVVAQFIAVNFFILQQPYYDQIPCSVPIWAGNVLVIVVLISVLIRGIRLMVLINVNETLRGKDSLDDSRTSSSIDSVQHVVTVPEHEKSTTDGAFKPDIKRSVDIETNKSTGKASGYANDNTDLPITRLKRRLRHAILFLIGNKKAKASDRHLATVIGCIAMGLLLANLALTYAGGFLVGAPLACAVPQWAFVPGYVVIAVFVIIAAPIVVFVLWNESDAYGICFDIMTFNCVGAVGFILYLLTSMVPVFQPLWAYLGPNVFPAIVFALGHITSVILPLLQDRNLPSFRFPRLSSSSSASTTTLKSEPTLQSFERLCLQDRKRFKQLTKYCAKAFC